MCGFRAISAGKALADNDKDYVLIRKSGNNTQISLASVSIGFKYVSGHTNRNTRNK